MWGGLRLGVGEGRKRGGLAYDMVPWFHVVAPIEEQKPAFKHINVVFKITPHPKNKVNDFLY